ncbi:MAG TPA: PilZ domain-containing protein [Candidatus Omnitrophota bacterium]|nr:PilZ domain-containing protein [Candidatus Omnitrophota bacterium]HRZ14606.1 PilZ domain-containing protein [Candidatus Omnitrophota bacterium]
MLEIKSRRIKTTVILELSGTIDIDSANLIERVGQALTDGYRDILCDFESVTSVDYSGLSALAIAFKNTVNHKGRMKFFSVPAHIMKTFSLVCLDKVFEIFPDEKSALKSLEDDTHISEIQRKNLRRRFKRLPLDIDIQFKSLFDQQFHHGKVMNISGIGMLVFAEKVYPIGEILEMKVSLLPIAPMLALKGKVVWLIQKEIQPQFYPGMGIEYYHIDCPTQEKILEFIERNLPLDSPS